MLSGVAVASAAAVTSVVATTPGSVAAANVELAALVVEGSSTNPTGEGIPDFYRRKFLQDEVVVVNFFTGPFGVYQALVANRVGDNVVLSSGWGAANVSLLLTYMDITGEDDSALTKTLYVLDNNVARPNGGFGTRYPVFALIGVNPIPTPTSPGAQVIDIGYEYDINGNTPAYVWNVVAMANSLAAYLDRRLNQSAVDLPVYENGNLVMDDSSTLDAENCTSSNPCRVKTDSGIARVEIVGETTYISYESDDLPLTRPLRSLGEPGIRLANAVDPALRAVVDYGYPDNDPLANPGEYVPARVIPRPQETVKFVNDFTDGVREGISTLDDNVTTTAAAVPSGDAQTRRPLSAVRESLNFSPRRSSERAESRSGARPTADAVKTGLGRLAKSVTSARNDDDADADADA